MSKEPSTNEIKAGYLVCPSCKVHFSSKDSKNLHTCRHPVLLKCGHSVCFSCIRRAYANLNSTDGKVSRTVNFVCPLCEKATELHGKLPTTDTDLDVNYYLFGWLESKQRKFLREEPKFTFLPAGADLHCVRPKDSSLGVRGVAAQSSVSESDSKPEETCMECLSAVAPWHCQNCASPYCDLCFNKVHSHSAMNKHTKTPATNASFYSGNRTDGYCYPKFCNAHPECVIEYVCKDDCELMCANCVLFDSHKGHTLLKLEEQNVACRAELSEFQSEFEEVLKALSVSIQAVKDLDSSSQNNWKKLADETQRYFVKCHGILQLVEKEALTKIKNTFEEKSRALKERDECLRSFQQELQFLKQILTSPVQDTAKGSVNVSAALTELKEKLSTPVCVMVKTEENLELVVPGVGCPQSYQLELQDFESSFDCLFNLKGNSGAEFLEVVPLTSLSTEQRKRLQQISSLQIPITGPEVQLTSMPTWESSEEKKFEIAPFATSSRHSSLSDLTTLIPTSLSSPAVPSKIPGNLVRVTCIVSPLEFYVRRVQDELAYRSLMDNLRKWGGCALTNPPPKQILPNKVYGMWNQSNDKWRRLRVTNEFKTGFKSSCDSQLIKGQCVDTGQRFEVSASVVRDLSNALLATPIFALHCSLDDVIPREGVDWNPNDVRWFSELLGSEILTLIEVRKEGSLHYVDLVSPGSTKQQNQCPVTVRDTLVHMGIARLRNPSSMHLVGHEPTRKYSIFRNFRVGEQKVGVVCYVSTPCKFYVQLLSAGEELHNLTVALQHHYNQGNITKMWSILSPRKGMLCVARFSADRFWYRAQIENVTNPRSAVVRYVDYGNTEALTIEELRTIDDKFLELPAMAICCKLANISPASHKSVGLRNQPEGLSWTTSAVGRFKELTFEKRVLVQISGVVEGGVGTFNFFPKPTTEFQLVVTLSPFQEGVCREKNVISINQVLVDEGCAVSELKRPTVTKEKGPKMTGSRRKKCDNERLTEKVQKSLAELQTQYSSVEVPGCQEDLPAMDGSLTNVNRQMTGGADKTTTSLHETNNRLEVTILDCQSPSEIIVSVRDMAPDLEKMMSSLPLFTLKETEESVQWKVGDWCLVKTEERQPWKRAKIVAMEEAQKGTATIFLIDAGRNLDGVPSVKLYPLPDDLKQYPASAVKVHLAGIQPAGGSKWSFLAKEQLQASVQNSFIRNCFLEMKGEPVNESIPVHLYCDVWHEGGAFEPGFLKTHSINQELLDSGLALPVRGHGIKEGSTNSGLGLRKLQELLTCSQTVASEVEIPPPYWLKNGNWEERNFKAVPTWVDMKGIIYLQDEVQVQRTAEMKGIMHAELERCEAQEHNQNWRVGQICSVKYVLDGHWYRGEILEVKDGEEEVGVRLADYGTEIDVNMKHLRTKLFFSNVPVQVWKCCLFNVLPAKGRCWDYESLDFLHKTIVDNECIVITKENKEIPEVNLVMFSGQDVGELFVSAGLAKRASPAFQFGQGRVLGCVDEDVDVSISSSVEACSVDEDIGEHFETRVFLSTDNKENKAVIQPLIPPQMTGAKFTVLVTALANANEVWLQPLPPFDVTTNTDANLAPFLMQLNWRLPEFEAMAEVLRNEGHTFPIVQNVRPGCVCCALFEEDQSWYRSVVQDLLVDSEGKETVSVLFVDYGNVDIVSFDKLRVLPENYIHIPAFVIRTRLPHQLKPVTETGAVEELLKQLVGNVFLAQVLNIEPFECLLTAEEGSIESEALKKVMESGFVEGCLDT